MRDSALQIYHSLPGPARSWAAWLRGAYLRSWRYSAATEQLVAEALERETWSAERWKSWQEERLAYVLHRAATQVPYYRQSWVDRRRAGDQASWQYLENWPVLEKELLRKHPEAFLADDCNVKRMYCEHTSGTTGTPLQLWFSRDTVRRWYALFEARSRHWYGVTRRDRWAILGGQLVTSVRRGRPPFWVWNGALNQLYMSSYHLAPKFIPSYLEALERHRVRYLVGYTSSLYSLAIQTLELRRHALKFEVVITNAEPLLQFQRQAIEQAFGCAVRETYGMAEIVTAAGECQHGKLHEWPEVGFTEILEGSQPLSRGASGNFVCTGLLNSDMPLIRYLVGDRGSLARDNACACGRNMPVLGGVEGRSDDVLYTIDGRPIGRLDPVFKEQLEVREAQIVQETLDRVRVRYVPATGFTTATAASIIERLHDRLGPVSVVLEEMDRIPREANGKFRMVVTKRPSRAPLLR